MKTDQPTSNPPTPPSLSPKWVPWSPRALATRPQHPRQSHHSARGLLLGLVFTRLGWGGSVTVGGEGTDARCLGSEEGMLALLLSVRQVHELQEQISSRAVQHCQVLFRRLLSPVAALVQAAGVHCTGFFNRKQNVRTGRVIWDSECFIFKWGRGCWQPGVPAQLALQLCPSC